MAKQVKNDTEKKPAGKGKIIIIALLALIIIGGATFGGVYFFILSKDKTEKVVVEATYVLSEETKINLNKKGSYVQTGISISYDEDNSKLAEEIETKKIKLQDKAIWYLKSKVTTDFDASNEVVLKKGLIDTLNKELENGKILDIYYSTGGKTANFTVQ